MTSRSAEPVTTGAPALEGNPHLDLGAAVEAVRPVCDDVRDRGNCRNQTVQCRAVAQLIQTDTLTFIEHIHRRQPPGRFGGHCHQHPLESLDQHRDSLPHADAHRRQPGLQRALLELDHEGKYEPRARRPEPALSYLARVGRLRRTGCACRRSRSRGPETWLVTPRPPETCWRK